MITDIITPAIAYPLLEKAWSHPANEHVMQALTSAITDGRPRRQENVPCVILPFTTERGSSSIKEGIIY